MARYFLDASGWRADPDVLIGGSPLRIFRLSAAGVAVLDAIEAGKPLPGGHHLLTQHLLDAGALHPRADPDCPTKVRPGDVTVVIPTYGADPSPAIAAALTAGVAQLIVVDDASPIPLTTPAYPGVGILRLELNQGPGGARNAGLAMVTTPFVAFIDSDAEPDRDCLRRLLWLFDDERVGLVAPRIRSRSGRSLIDRYERWRSPLDLGPQPARIRAGSRVSYVPAAALLVRTEAARAVGGFDPTLRYGEDVDLVWRLDQAGWMCRYEPAASATHNPRPTLSRWIRQRVDYGSAAAALDRRHPGALSPTRTSRWSATIWALIAVGQPEAAGLVCVGTIVALAGKLDRLSHPVKESLRLAGRGNLFSGRLYASALTRVWWPIALAAALFSRRARRMVLAAAIVPSLHDWVKERPDLDPATAVAMRLVDDVSYGTGVWLGMLRERLLSPIIPAFPELTPPTVAPALRRWMQARRHRGLS